MIKSSLKQIKCCRHNFTPKIHTQNSEANSEILFKKLNHIGSILLNRPQQLNALNMPMAKLMSNQLECWENDAGINAIVIKGAGDEAFCAGGDAKFIFNQFMKGDKHKGMDSFKEIYRLKYKIANLKKPYIALINGITMGGGVGLSVHGRYRIATEKTIFAMPEAAIGFFADIGASYFLPRLKHNIGLYLVLTGHRLNGKDVKKCGIATHYINSTRLKDLKDAIFNLNDSTPEKIANLLNTLTEKVDDNFDSSLIEANFKAASSIEEIYSNLKNDGSDWAKRQLKVMSKMSPTSLKVAIKQMELGSRKNLKECLEMEYQLCSRFTRKNDIFEGVRAMLVDKDYKPKWNPSSHDKIDDQQIEWYFKPMRDDDKLFSF